MIKNYKSILSKKQVNRTVLEMHKGKPHIRTEVVFLTPIEDSAMYRELDLHGSLDELIDDMVDETTESIGETFEADIESVHVTLKKIY